MLKRSKQQNKFQQVLTNSKQTVKNRGVPSSSDFAKQNISHEISHA